MRLGRKKITVYSLQKTRLHHCQHRLTGKAQGVCAALSLEDSFDYDVIKAAIFRAYELIPEAYRQRFFFFIFIQGPRKQMQQKSLGMLCTN